ncbi:hypothetical protein [Streptomyces sp. A30]|uniref:hypothetical protein n=1 Tax=Streptomyces sp. A30 TaxID=2789273 RepID=UPI0039816203
MGSYEDLSTEHLCNALDMGNKVNMIDSCEEIMDVLRARHPEVQEALMQWAETGKGPGGDTDHIEVALKACRAVVEDR